MTDKKKYLYIVTTKQTVEQTWEYEFESDEELTQRQAFDYIYKNNVEGHCMDDDKVTDESLWDFHKHEVTWEVKWAANAAAPVEVKSEEKA